MEPSLIPPPDTVSVYHRRGRTLRLLTGRIVAAPEGPLLVLPNRQWVPMSETVSALNAAWDARVREVLGDIPHTWASRSIPEREAREGVTLDFVGLIRGGGNVTLYPVKATTRGYSLDLPWGALRYEGAAVGFVAEILRSTVGKDVVGVVYDVR